MGKQDGRAERPIGAVHAIRLSETGQGRGEGCYRRTGGHLREGRS